VNARPPALSVATGGFVAAGIAGPRAEGRYALVAVRLSSDAAGVTLRSGRLGTTLRGAGRTEYRRARRAERALAAAGIPAGLPNVPLPAGVATRSTIVFDIPVDAALLRLRIRDAHPLAAATELFLIGDEDSFPHARTWFVLDPPADLAVSSIVRLAFNLPDDVAAPQLVLRKAGALNRPAEPPGPRTGGAGPAAETGSRSRPA
jgi:hypothetical protein